MGILSGKLFFWLLSIIVNFVFFLSSSHPRSFFMFFFIILLPFLCLPPAVDGNTWAQVIALYPTLVECITCTSPEVSSALKEALGPFKDFMQPPVSRVQNGESWPGSASALCFSNWIGLECVFSTHMLHKCTDVNSTGAPFKVTWSSNRTVNPRSKARPDRFRDPSYASLFASHVS